MDGDAGNERPVLFDVEEISVIIQYTVVSRPLSVGKIMAPTRSL
jgi:hypothetical protein